MAEHDAQRLLEDLDAQCQDYQQMYRAGIRQRDCLRADDLEGLQAASSDLRRLMDSVRRRQRRLPDDLAGTARQVPEVAQRTAALRRLVCSVQEVRDQSETAARALMEATRRQLRQTDTGRRASRGYRPRAVQDARFVDGTR